MNQLNTIHLRMKIFLINWKNKHLPPYAFDLGRASIYTHRLTPPPKKKKKKKKKEAKSKKAKSYGEPVILGLTSKQELS